jgi:PadR family transcriptional regulator, regulatory protein PadR
MEPIKRVTAPTLDVLAALLDGTAAGGADAGPTWGLLVIKRTGRAPGTVYPILERLERQGWVRSSWEDDDVDRSGPRRRLYEFTADGVLAARELVAASGSAAGAGSARRPRSSGSAVTS